MAGTEHGSASGLRAGELDATFELAPVSLWLEDYSELRALFAQWRAAGVRDLAAFLREDPARITRCAGSLRVLAVNRRTLELYEARDLAHLTDNLTRVFAGEMERAFVDELAMLWDGRAGFVSRSVNTTLTGRPIDIQLSARILPGAEDSWNRVLVAIENVTDREQALRRAEASDRYARGLFQHSPVALWVQDFRGVHRLLAKARAAGVRDFRAFTSAHPDFVDRCAAAITVLDVNQHTLDLFKAPDKATLLGRLGDVFRDKVQAPFRDQLAELWDGKLFQCREVLNYALDGSELHLHLQFSVLPGHEDDWSLVQVALTDITARKRTESYLEYLGNHDTLTRLFNRAFYKAELERLDRVGRPPVTVVMADLNGLKAVNDRRGHAAGDDLLARAGEVLAQAVCPPGHAARIGGDEFALVLPGADEAEGERVMGAIGDLVTLNNQFHSRSALSLSLGAATGRPGEPLERVARRADQAMYAAKRAFHARRGDRRRATG